MTFKSRTIQALLLIGLATLAFSRAEAQESGRRLSTTYTIEAGSEHAFNTYLSPLPHTGSSYALSGAWSRSLGEYEKMWDMTFTASGRIGLMKNPARNAAMDDVALALSWYAQKGFMPIPGLTLKAGGGVQADGGLLYLPRNSNNPVAARAYLGLTVNGSALYKTQLWGYPIRLIDEVSIPTLGVFFSPHYGQSYYEIYLGDTSGLARCGWWGNHFAINNLTAIEIPVCSVRLRIGYRLNILNTIASDINSRITNHSIVLGISTDWINVTRHNE